MQAGCAITKAAHSSLFITHEIFGGYVAVYSASPCRNRRRGSIPPETAENQVAKT